MDVVTLLGKISFAMVDMGRRYGAGDTYDGGYCERLAQAHRPFPAQGFHVCSWAMFRRWFRVWHLGAARILRGAHISWVAMGSSRGVFQVRRRMKSCVYCC